MTNKAHIPYTSISIALLTGIAIGYYGNNYLREKDSQKIENPVVMRSDRAPTAYSYTDEFITFNDDNAAEMQAYYAKSCTPYECDVNPLFLERTSHGLTQATFRFPEDIVITSVPYDNLDGYVFYYYAIDRDGNRSLTWRFRYNGESETQ